MRTAKALANSIAWDFVLKSHIHSTPASGRCVYRADKVIVRAVFGIPLMFVIIAGDAVVLLKINLHPLAEVHQIGEQVLDIIFIAVEILPSRVIQ